MLTEVFTWLMIVKGCSYEVIVVCFYDVIFACEFCGLGGLYLLCYAVEGDEGPWRADLSINRSRNGKAYRKENVAGDC